MEREGVFRPSEGGREAQTFSPSLLPLPFLAGKVGSIPFLLLFPLRQPSSSFLSTKTLLSLLFYSGATSHFHHAFTSSQVRYPELTLHVGESLSSPSCCNEMPPFALEVAWRGGGEGGRAGRQGQPDGRTEQTKAAPPAEAEAEAEAEAGGGRSVGPPFLLSFRPVATLEGQKKPTVEGEECGRSAQTIMTPRIKKATGKPLREREKKQHAFNSREGSRRRRPSLCCSLLQLGSTFSQKELQWK